MTRKRFLFIAIMLIILSTAAVLLSSPLNALIENRRIEKYPDRPIEMIVSFKEGGGTDIGARLLQEYLEDELGQQVLIRNIDGNDGEVGYSRLAKADPTGYTIGFINLPTFVSLPIQRQTTYRISDIALIGNYVFDPAVLVVRNDGEWNSFEEWLVYCMKNPLDMTVSNNGVAASNHIAAAYLEHEAKIELTHVPFGGTTDMLKALELKFVKASVAKVSEVAQGVNNGTLRVLITFTEERVPYYADVPTLTEKSFPIVFGSARALAVPADTPEEIVVKLEEAFLSAYHNPRHKMDAEEISLPLSFMNREELTDYMREQELYLKEILPQIGL
jgi:tripartite-type tricarboxylate transporter receptor subunit TctC